MFLTVIEFMLFLIEREKNKQRKETIKPNFIGKNFGKYSNCPNGIFHRTRTSNFTICMEIQKTSNSQSNLEKEVWSWRNQPA